MCQKLHDMTHILNNIGIFQPTAQMLVPILNHFFLFSCRQILTKSGSSCGNIEQKVISYAPSRIVVASLNFKPAGFFDKGGFDKAGCVLNRHFGSDKWLRFSARVGKSSLSNFQTLAWSLKIEILAIYHWMGGQILSEIIKHQTIYQFSYLYLKNRFLNTWCLIFCLIMVTLLQKLPARKRNTQDVGYNSMQFSKPVFEKVTI